MRNITGVELYNLLSSNNAFGCKVLETPYVFVLKSSQGTFVVLQDEGRQSPSIIGSPLFSTDSLIEGVFDIELKAGKHCIALAVRTPVALGVDEPVYYLIGEKVPVDDESKEAVTAFFAYEFEANRSVNSVHIIEERGDKPIISDGIRYGKNSSKMLKTQLHMYLSFAGIDSDSRHKIVSGSLLLPSNEKAVI